MERHTKGPWLVTRAYVEPGASEFTCTFTTNKGVAGHTELNENVNLLQCAPELLEALEAILPFIPTTSASEGGAARFSANVAAADKVRAAIVKARGQA